MKASKLMTAMFLGSALVLSACNKKADDSTGIASRSGRGGSTVYSPVGVYYTAATGSVQPASGLTSSGVTKASVFQDVVKGLISASMDTSGSNVGAIDTSSVKFTGYVELDSSGNVLANRSSIQIEVDDQRAAGVSPIYLHVPASSYVDASTNHYTNGYPITLDFEDSYGHITLVGQLSSDGRTFSGALNYANKTIQTPGESVHAATNMMYFQIDTCGFFRCH